MRKLFVSSEFTKGFVNFLYLGSAQFLNYAIPILLIPFIVEKVGMEEFGSLSLMQIILFYVSIFVNYSFQLTATLEIAKGNSHNNSFIFCNIISTKFFIALLSMPISCIALRYIVGEDTHFLVYVGVFFYSLGIAITPDWFFHGVQKLEYLLLINLLSKGLYGLVVLLLIKSTKDSYWIILGEGLLCFVIGLLFFLFSIKQFDIDLKFSNFSEIIGELKKGYEIFASIILTTSYTKLMMLILGISASKIEVAKYSAVERVVFLINGLVSMVSRVIFPYLSFYRENNRHTYNNLIKYFGVFLFIVTSTIYIFSFLYSDIIILKLINQTDTSIILMFNILNSTIVTAALCSFFSLLMVLENLKNYLFWCNLGGCIFGVVIIIPLIHIWGAIGLSIGLSINALMIFILSAFFLKNKSEVLVPRLLEKSSHLN